MVILSFSLISGVNATENNGISDSSFLSDDNSSIVYDEKFYEQLNFNDAVVQKHKKYREANNLDYSNEAIQKALKSSNAPSTILTYSIALTEEEESYIRERDALMVEYADPISSLLKENGITKTTGPNNEVVETYSTIGTFYQEKKNGLKFIVSFSESNERVDQVKKSIEELVPAKYLEFRNANFSEAELVDAYENLMNESRQSGIQIEEAEVAIKENSVVVKAEDTATVNLIEKNSLQDRTSLNSSPDNQPSIFKIVTGKSNTQAEARNSKLDTMVGGLLISDSVQKSTDSIGFCTLGTTATKGTDRFLITAGHCFDSWGPTIFQGGEQIGTDHYQYMGDYADIAVIKASNNKKISNYIYKYSWTDSRVTSYQTSSSSLKVGDNICMSGAKTGFSCGEVTSLNSTGIPGTGIGFIKTDIDSEAGDSGSPYWYDGVLMGIHSGGEVTGPPFTVFTHISKAIAYAGGWTPYTSNTVK